MNKDMEQI